MTQRQMGLAHIAVLFACIIALLMTKPRVCIIHFTNGFQNPGVTGWVRKDSYVIDEVLGELQDDGSVYSDTGGRYAR